MFARVATLEGGNIEKLREFVEQMRATPNMGLPEGVRRAVSLASGNKRLFITYFDSREALEAAEPAFDAMGGKVPEDARGQRTGVEVFEVIVDTTL